MAKKCYELTDRFIVNSSIDDVWRFFSTADNLPAITPTWLKFVIVTPSPIVLKKDAFIEYTIRPLGFRMKWRTRIIGWDQPRRFVDIQERGPYALWWHEHIFEPRGSGVHCTDRVLYRMPMGFIGHLAHRLLVRRQLMEIFQYRRRIISERLNGIWPQQPNIVIRQGDFDVPLD